MIEPETDEKTTEEELAEGPFSCPPSGKEPTHILFLDFDGVIFWPWGAEYSRDFRAMDAKLFPGVDKDTLSIKESVRQMRRVQSQLFDRRCIACLDSIIDAVRKHRYPASNGKRQGFLGIVVTSSHRSSFTTQEIRENYREWKFAKNIVGRTSGVGPNRRSDRIRAYLPRIEQLPYAILDDYDDTFELRRNFIQEFVYVSERPGHQTYTGAVETGCRTQDLLSPVHAKEVLKILLRPPPQGAFHPPSKTPSGGWKVPPEGCCTIL